MATAQRDAPPAIPTQQNFQRRQSHQPQRRRLLAKLASVPAPTHVPRAKMGAIQMISNLLKLVEPV